MQNISIPLVASWIQGGEYLSRKHRLFNCNAWLVFTPPRGKKKKERIAEARCYGHHYVRKTRGSREEKIKFLNSSHVSPRFDPVPSASSLRFQAKNVLGLSVQVTIGHGLIIFGRDLYIFALQCEFLKWNFVHKNIYVHVSKIGVDLTFLISWICDIFFFNLIYHIITLFYQSFSS